MARNTKPSCKFIHQEYPTQSLTFAITSLYSCLHKELLLWQQGFTLDIDWLSFSPCRQWTHGLVIASLVSTICAHVFVGHIWKKWLTLALQEVFWSSISTFDFRQKHSFEVLSFSRLYPGRAFTIWWLECSDLIGPSDQVSLSVWGQEDFFFFLMDFADPTFSQHNVDCW